MVRYLYLVLGLILNLQLASPIFAQNNQTNSSLGGLIKPLTPKTANKLSKEVDSPEPDPATEEANLQEETNLSEVENNFQSDVQILTPSNNLSDISKDEDLKNSENTEELESDIVEPNVARDFTQYEMIGQPIMENMFFNTVFGLLTVGSIYVSVKAINAYSKLKSGEKLRDNYPPQILFQDALVGGLAGATIGILVAGVLTAFDVRFTEIDFLDWMFKSRESTYLIDASLDKNLHNSYNFYAFSYRF